MVTTHQQQLQAYFFEPTSTFDIHCSTLRFISTTTLKYFRIIGWIIMTIILVLLQRVNWTFFANAKFLSDQGFILTWLYFGLVTQHHLLNRGKIQPQTQISPKIRYIAQMLFELALCFEVPITIIEWTLLFEEQAKTETQEQVLVQILEHSAPIILLLVDLTCNCCRFLRKRLYFVIAYAIAYLIVNLSYSVAVEPVYDIITWLDLESYIYVVAVTIMIIGTHFLARKIFTTFKQPKLQNRVLISPNQPRSVKQMQSEEESK